MARQIGPVFFEKTIEDMTYYKMLGEYFARKRSRLTAKMVKTQKRFRNTMIYAHLLAKASKIGSAIYQQLPGNWRQFWMYRSFTGEAMQLLKSGVTEQQAREYLWLTYVAHWEQLKAMGVWEEKGLRVAEKRRPTRQSFRPKRPKGSKRRNYKRPVWISREEKEQKRLALEKKRTICKQLLAEEKLRKKRTLQELLARDKPRVAIPCGHPPVVQMISVRRMWESGMAG